MGRDELNRKFLADPDLFVDLFLKLIEENQALQKRCAELEQRIIKLEGQLAKNSQNSGKPPSSDGLKKLEKTKGQRETTGKKPGGQPGHAPSRLKPVDNPDNTEIHKARTCAKCGKSLMKQTILGYIQRQVFDLPVLKVLVTAHLTERRQCKCGHVTTGSFPSGVNKEVQYGPNITALALSLSATQFIPFGRIKDFFSEVFGQKISTGTIAGMIKRSSENLSAFEQEAVESLLKSHALHSDETGISVGGKLNWIHTLGNKSTVLFFTNAKRGRKAMEDIGILLRYTGTLIHDFFRPYFTLNVSHGICNAHILRELRFEAEEMGQAWARRMMTTLRKLKEIVEKLKVPKRSPEFWRAVRSYDRLVKIGLQANPAARTSGKRGRTGQSSTRNLLVRLRDHREDILRFAFYHGIPFDNNLAERDIRMVKIKSKVSGCFRSMGGAIAFCRIRSYVATMRKRGIGMYAALVELANGHPIALEG